MLKRECQRKRRLLGACKKHTSNRGTGGGLFCCQHQMEMFRRLAKLGHYGTTQWGFKEVTDEMRRRA